VRPEDYGRLKRVGEGEEPSRRIDRTRDGCLVFGGKRLVRGETTIANEGLKRATGADLDTQPVLVGEIEEVLLRQHHHVAVKGQANENATLVHN
jgi:hypothetical protein